MAKSRSIPKPPANLAGYDPTRDADGFWWDGRAAADAVDFFPCFCCHVKGHTGRFQLERWQEDWIATLYGWKRHSDGTRRYRECLAAVPRKNGKTATAAGLGLLELFVSNESGPEVYCAAGSRDQATLVFDPAAYMVRQSKALNQRAKIIDSTKRITYPEKNGFYRAIPAEAATSHGFNPSCVIFDELHTQPNRDLYDVLKTGMGARSQPLFISITTAGHDRHSICYEVWDYARQVRDGIIKDPHFLPLIYEFTDGDDWHDEDVWQRCNPNLGVSVSLDFLREEHERASASPAYENTFRNLYLNQWTEQAVRWLPMDAWEECNHGLANLRGQSCTAGLDMSTTTDITAFVMAFPIDGQIVLECRFWVPEESARKRAHRDRAPYLEWMEKGWITATPGNSVDYDRVRADINELQQTYNIQLIAIDRWNATQLAQQLEGDGFDVGLFGQGYASMSAPSKQLEAMVVDRKLNHQGNPVLRWMAGNVAREEDAAGNIKPSKKASTERIDGIVAAVMAIGAQTEMPGDSVYATEEVFYL